MEVTTSSNPATLAAKFIGYRSGSSQIVKGLTPELADWVCLGTGGTSSAGGMIT